MYRILFVRAGTWIDFQYNFHPFEAYFYENNYRNPKSLIYNFFGNILLFVPFGILLPLLYISFKKFKNYFLFLISTILCIEFIQLFTRVGIFDIDDIVLNSIGGVLGYFIIKKLLNYTFFKKIFYD
ncbi:VanZ family protein [Paenibacillus chitinolyticus]|uniref:VanZ family protein n=1 Tax=Paenibacillus chitinolyticus TaxID=79263 RepID=UPI0038681DCA